MARSERRTARVVIRYEHPLNERIRTLMRLEDLFARVGYFAAQDAAPDHHAALLALFEITDVAARADLKTDLLQELERQKQMLAPLRAQSADRAARARGAARADRRGQCAAARAGRQGRRAPARKRMADGDQAAHRDPGRRLRIRPARLSLVAAPGRRRARRNDLRRLDRAVRADPRRLGDRAEAAARQRPREPAHGLSRRVPADADDDQGRAIAAPHARAQPALRARDQRQQVRAQHPLPRRSAAWIAARCSIRTSSSR